MKKRISIALLSSLLSAGMSFNALAVDYSSADVIARIQEALNEEGYDCGTPDGKVGAKTEAAVSHFREEHNLPAGNSIDDDLVNALGLTEMTGAQAAKDRPVSAKEIRFRDIPWYTSKTAAEKTLFGEGAKEAGSLGSPENIYRMSGTDYSHVTTGSDRVDGGGYRGWYENITVAGYVPSDVYACYMFPFEGDQLNHSNEEALFYMGFYQFSGKDFQDYQGIYDDFVAKLSSLYGEGIPSADKYRTTTTWEDSDGNQIRLLINDKKDYVCLTYIASGAEARLDEVQAALDAEALAAEAAQREENQENVDGL